MRIPLLELRRSATLAVLRAEVCHGQGGVCALCTPLANTNCLVVWVGSWRLTACRSLQLFSCNASAATRSRSSSTLHATSTSKRALVAFFWSGLSRCSRQSPVSSCVVSRAASPLSRSRATGGLCGGRAVGLTSVDNPVDMCGGAPCYRLASCVSHVQQTLLPSKA
eukprot:scaffold3808_cov112-Isochrysis_galbana.AAC.31